MPRNMSFFLTTPQVNARTKTVTRRNGWKFLKAGDIVTACEKCQGLKKDEKIKKLVNLRILSVTFEPPNAITREDCVKEGFPEMSPNEFVVFYAKHNKCDATHEVTRIEFEYLDEVKVCFVGTHFKPGLKALDSSTKSGQIVDRKKAAELIKKKTNRL